MLWIAASRPALYSASDCCADNPWTRAIRVLRHFVIAIPGANDEQGDQSKEEDAARDA